MITLKIKDYTEIVYNVKCTNDIIPMVPQYIIPLLTNDNEIYTSEYNEEKIKTAYSFIIKYNGYDFKMSTNIDFRTIELNDFINTELLNNFNYSDIQKVLNITSFNKNLMIACIFLLYKSKEYMMALLNVLDDLTPVLLYNKVLDGLHIYVKDLYKKLYNKSIDSLNSMTSGDSTVLENKSTINVEYNTSFTNEMIDVDSYKNNDIITFDRMKVEITNNKVTDTVRDDLKDLNTNYWECLYNTDGSINYYKRYIDDRWIIKDGEELKLTYLKLKLTDNKLIFTNTGSSKSYEITIPAGEFKFHITSANSDYVTTEDINLTIDNNTYELDFNDTEYKYYDIKKIRLHTNDDDNNKCYYTIKSIYTKWYDYDLISDIKKQKLEVVSENKTVSGSSASTLVNYLNILDEENSAIYIENNKIGNSTEYIVFKFLYNNGNGYKITKTKNGISTQVKINKDMIVGQSSINLEDYITNYDPDSIYSLYIDSENNKLIEMIKSDLYSDYNENGVKYNEIAITTDGVTTTNEIESKASIAADITQDDSNTYYLDSTKKILTVYSPIYRNDAFNDDYSGMTHTYWGKFTLSNSDNTKTISIPKYKYDNFTDIFSIKDGETDILSITATSTDKFIDNNHYLVIGNLVDDNGIIQYNADKFSILNGDENYVFVPRDYVYSNNIMLSSKPIITITLGSTYTNELYDVIENSIKNYLDAHATVNNTTFTNVFNAYTTYPISKIEGIEDVPAISAIININIDIPIAEDTVYDDLFLLFNSSNFKINYGNNSYYCDSFEMYKQSNIITLKLAFNINMTDYTFTKYDAVLANGTMMLIEKSTTSDDED